MKFFKDCVIQWADWLKESFVKCLPESLSFYDLEKNMSNVPVALEILLDKLKEFPTFVILNNHN